MDIYYVNSQGEKLDLVTYPYLMLADTDLFDYTWSNTTKGTSFPRISSFSRSMVQKKIKIRIKGLNELDYLNNIEKITAFFDADVVKLSPGRLYVDNYYLDCYIFASSKNTKYLMVNNSTVQFTLLSPDGNWKTSNVFHFGMAKDDGVVTDETFLDYPLEYKYDYVNDLTFNSLLNDGYAPSDFKLTIYGRCSDPLISIGDWNYGATDVDLKTGEKLIIDSVNKKVYKVTVTGVIENLFSHRLKDFYAFQKIEVGQNIVGWNGAYAFDVELFEDRSEPKWT